MWLRLEKPCERSRWEVPAGKRCCWWLCASHLAQQLSLTHSLTDSREGPSSWKRSPRKWSQNGGHRWTQVDNWEVLGVGGTPYIGCFPFGFPEERTSAEWVSLLRPQHGGFFSVSLRTRKNKGHKLKTRCTEHGRRRCPFPRRPKNGASPPHKTNNKKDNPRCLFFKATEKPSPRRKKDHPSARLFFFSQAQASLLEEQEQSQQAMAKAPTRPGGGFSMRWGLSVGGCTTLSSKRRVRPFFGTLLEKTERTRNAIRGFHKTDQSLWKLLLSTGLL